MRTVGLIEAKQKLSELVQRAKDGERIGITHRGELAAYLVPVETKTTVKVIFDEIERLRKPTRRVKGVTVRSLIEKGRM